MKKIYVFGLILAAFGMSACAIQKPPMNNPVNNTVDNSTNNTVVSGTLQECPSEKIINSMPGIGGGEEYYILNGKRREVQEFDAAWVAAHCKVPVQEVQ